MKQGGKMSVPGSTDFRVRHYEKGGHCGPGSHGHLTR